MTIDQPKIHEFPKGLTVTELKRIIKDWPEINDQDEPTEVWVSEGNVSSVVKSIWPLNASYLDTGNMTCDIILKIKD